jgi:hypothetical protein
VRRGGRAGRASGPSRGARASVIFARRQVVRPWLPLEPRLDREAELEEAIARRQIAPDRLLVGDFGIGARTSEGGLSVEFSSVSVSRASASLIRSLIGAVTHASCSPGAKLQGAETGVSELRVAAGGAGLAHAARAPTTAQIRRPDVSVRIGVIVTSSSSGWPRWRQRCVSARQRRQLMCEMF